jgi:hypothetical protein
VIRVHSTTNRNSSIARHPHARTHALNTLPPPRCEWLQLAHKRPTSAKSAATDAIAAAALDEGANAELGGSAQAGRVVLEEARLGSEIRDVLLGVAPLVQVQQGSPSSSPLDWPSPSLSARHSPTDHVCPADANSEPKVFREPPPDEETCPTPAWPGTANSPKHNTERRRQGSHRQSASMLRLPFAASNLHQTAHRLVKLPQVALTVCAIRNAARISFRNRAVESKLGAPRPHAICSSCPGELIVAYSA